MMTPPWSAKL